jgi:hypothetical protein
MFALSVLAVYSVRAGWATLLLSAALYFVSIVADNIAYGDNCDRSARSRARRCSGSGASSPAPPAGFARSGASF